MIGVSADGIVGGHASDASDDAVVLILSHQPAKDTSKGQFYLNCTGTLLSPSIVLTARHCVSNTTEGMFRCEEDGTRASGSGGQALDDFTAANTSVFVGAKLPLSIRPSHLPKARAFIHDDATILCNEDVALILLAEPIEGAKIARIRLEGDVTKDEELYVVGWGATEKVNMPLQRQRRDGVSAVEVGPSTTLYVGGQLGDKEFIASESVCFGDSGGPAFDAKTNAVVGTVSRGPNGGVTANGSGCVGKQHTFMKVAPFKDLVMEAFAQTGGEPWLEEQTQPTMSISATSAGADGGSDAGKPETTADAVTTTKPPRPSGSEDDASTDSGCTSGHGPTPLSWIRVLAGLALMRVVTMRRRGAGTRTRSGGGRSS